jgi:hypothetical protein
MAEEKTAMSKAKRKSIRDCREKTPTSSKKIRKTPKAHPWSFLFPSHTIFDIRLFLLQKASSNPKTDPGSKRNLCHNSLAVQSSLSLSLSLSVQFSHCPVVSLKCCGCIVLENANNCLIQKWWVFRPKRSVIFHQIHKIFPINYFIKYFT